MQENEFEKRVRELMEEFNISPSETIWDKVEKQIPKQKRRRRWMVLIFFFAGLIVSGYFIYNNFHLSSSNQIVALKNENDKTQKKSNEVQKSIESGNARSLPNSVDQKKGEEKNVITPGKQVNRKSVSANSSGMRIPKKEVESREAQTSAKANDVTFEKNQVLSNNDVEKNILSDSINSIETALLKKEKSTDTVRKEMPDSSYSTITSKKQSSKITNNKKWQFGIAAFYGRSDVFENLLGVKLGNNADQMGSGNPTSGYTSDTLKGSGSVGTKGAFSLGVIIKKKLSSKSSLTFGVQYLKLQTEIETGALKDSAAIFYYNNVAAAPVTSVTNFYQSGKGNSRINSYHLIQVPIIYEHSMLKNKILNWNAGLSFSRIIASNALVYDSYHQAYYNNNDLFRKTQITFLGGINTQFKLRSSAISVGPQVQYGLTNLLKSNSYGSQHLFTYGIQANIFFKK